MKINCNKCKGKNPESMVYRNDELVCPKCWVKLDVEEKKEGRQSVRLRGVLHSGADCRGVQRVQRGGV